MQDAQLDAMLVRYGLPPLSSPQYQDPAFGDPRLAAYDALMVKLGFYKPIPDGPIPIRPVHPVDPAQWPPSDLYRKD